MSDDYLSSPISIGAPSGKNWFFVLDITSIICRNKIFILKKVASQKQQQQRVQALSPYLNYDPRFLQQAQPEFIFPEGASRQRGRFELAFSQIGSSVMIGAAIGGTAGLYNGVRATALAGQTGKLRRTQYEKKHYFTKPR